MSTFAKLCISCELLQLPNQVVEETGTNYSNNEAEDKKQVANDYKHGNYFFVLLQYLFF